MAIKLLTPLEVNKGVSASIAQFTRHVNQSIAKFNRDIKVYNSVADADVKANMLHTLNQQLHALNNTCASMFLEKVPACYEKLQKQLHAEMQAESRTLGILLVQGDIQQKRMRDEQSALKLELMMADRSDDSVQLLSRQMNLVEGESGESLSLDGMDDFDVTISSLANNRNFLVSHKSNPEEKYMLQLENRGDISLAVESSLKKAGFSNFFIPILLSKPVFFQTVDKATLPPEFTEADIPVAARNIKVMPLMTGSSPTRVIQSLPPEQRLDKIIDVSTQMAAMLAVLESKGCAFPDMKNDNWFVDEFGNLYISDTKTLVFSDEAGLLDEQDKEGKNLFYKEARGDNVARAGTRFSYHMVPPEAVAGGIRPM
ncbi:MAG: hypothetical protein K0U24_04890 [Gammaproteobacteria bacterium]|nr:hypothetical protein [Gammaproteobacteria bacterium]MCH9763553.1 hypothetical protein [Gammaproteobacteria bacterium]